ncbi:hypothetical protein SAMN05443572_1011422 [Myxococcus fulvus]|uniref:Lipoprotein n=1 Tax=Myxococcus fulvus TaxID=33 RepID=A0A511SSX4_MYXFU|nr:hypothetical protein [Myxococcus fulvus]GEN05034.1 hypothetical protein MFU01_00710 [Myxococcus fulvus]SET20125.1 hypothetical protein SAMN05443572_1011422 [Myxococcus fulvus]
MRPLRRTCFALGISFVVSGCATTLYKPNQVSAPLLREEGELKGTLGNNNLQVAWSPRAGVGLLAQGYYERYAEGERRASGVLGEVGGGLYGTFLGNAVWEAYGGLGYGQSTASDRVDANSAPPRDVGFTARAVRAFIQPNLGYVTPYFELAGSVRMSALKYVSLDANGYTAEERTREFLVADDVTGPVWLFAEPALTVKGGYKWVKLYAQRTWALKLGGEPLPHERDSTVVGLSVNVAHWYDDFQWGSR